MNATVTVPRRHSRVRAVALVTTIAVLGALLPAVAAQAADPLPDGKSELTAAASCWEVKQNYPASTDGIYWIYTPALGAADRFYCDQTTDGGGWVLIGRGRENWSETNEGLGTSADVRDTVTGPDAFVPRQLDADTVNGLLNDESVTSLADGIRLRRATNTAGSSFQEVSFTFSSPRDDWSWLFNAEQRIATWKIDGRSGTGGTTKSFGTGSSLQRVTYDPSASNGWSNGFGYGTSVSGSTASNSYIYKASTGYARPFTQVYLRPQLTSTEIFTTIPDTGMEEYAQRSIASSFALPTVWGVSGLGAAGTGINNTEVAAFAESNGVVYVGGNFLNVQKTSSGGSQVAQSYLAAFDVNTGELISSFRPTFDNQVKALAALPDGRIAVGGNFSNVNGSEARGLVVLNADGTTDTEFSGTLINKLSSSGGQSIVRSLDVEGDWLYAGGSFTHAAGGSYSGEVYSRAAVRMSISDGTPDSSWRVNFDGTVNALDASENGDKVYFAGYFGSNNSVATVRAAAVTADDATLIPWTVNLSSTERSGYQQAVKEVGDRVWLGGSEHMLFSYDRNTMEEVSTNITIQGGDFQAISADGGDNIYAGCHCAIANYEGARSWPSVGTEWTRASKIDQTGVWSASTGAYQAEFSPAFDLREGAGTWALLTDSTGVTWMGGDFTAARRSETSSQWTGGFARFASVDSTAPGTPSALSATAAGQNVELSWTGSTDESGTVTYHVLRDDRVIATTTSTSVTLPAAAEGAKYFVRAADTAGNLSASTPAVEVGGSTPVDPNNPVLVSDGSVWAYYYDSSAPASSWSATDFDDTSWVTGAAPIGWGHSALGTELTTMSPRPLSSYYRKSFSVVDASKVESVTLTTRADDGILVYVNGVEVLRSNLPSGTIGHSSYAIAAPSAASAVANPVTVTVPGDLFTTGDNEIAVQVVSNYRSTPSQSFELNAVATFGTQPSQPEEPVEPTDPEEPTDPVEPTDPEEPTTPDEPSPVSTQVIADGSTWTYSYAAEAPAGDWKAIEYDDAAWSNGAAPLGWGHTVLGTTLSGVDPRPLTSYFRSAFEITDPSAYASLTLTTRADDGIAVYVNGTEVGRSNLPSGALNHNSYATTAPNAATALANPVTFTVPASLLVSGENVISVEVHSNWRSTPSSSFELEATAQPAA